MKRRHVVARSALLICMGSLPSLLSSNPASSQQRGGARITLIRDAETESLVNGFAAPLFGVAGVSPGLVRISLVRDRALNAFVTTGNRMFLNTGLIQQASTALEVIGAMAHETGHVAHGDISRLPEQALQALLESLGSMLIGVAAGVASRNPGVGAGMVLGGQSMAERRFMAFTRTQEISADQSALNYLDRLGWSPQGMLNLFERLEQEEALVIDRRDPYVVTHPFSRDRLVRVQDHVARIGARGTHATDGFEPPFRMVKAKLDAFLEAPAYVARAYPAADPAPETRYANAVLAHRMGHRDTAVSILDGLIRQAPSSPWLYELKGQVLLEGGQAQAAAASYQTAMRHAPNQPLIRQGYGHALLETGDATMIRQSVAQLQAAQGRERGDPTTWHLLGIAWGRLGNVGEANLALAEEAMLYGNIPVARRFARQAADALPPGPSRLRALDITNASKKENRS
ncbi:MAG: M48 family metalloprotease [Acetobacteraceae bacterium]